MIRSAAHKKSLRKGTEPDNPLDASRNESALSDWDYTEHAYRKLGDVVTHTDFYRNSDTILIYRQLSQNMHGIPFCEYLKRYIYAKAQLTDDPRTVSTDDYRFLIVSSFRENNTQASFTETKTKLSAAAQNWLTQKKVSRKTVLLLGFGLHMSAEDVDRFLDHALHEEKLRQTDEFEAVCKYSFEQGLSFIRMKQLWAYYQTLSGDDASCAVEAPLSAKEKNEMKKLYRFFHDNGTVESPAYRTFVSLYEEARKTIAAALSESYCIDAEILRRRSLEQSRRNGYSSDKIRTHGGALSLPKTDIAGNEITPSDAERVFCAAIPLDPFGNPAAQYGSELKEQLAGTQMTRKHIDNLLKKKTDVSRADILMLCFYLFSYGDCKSAEADVRYRCFCEYANENLRKSNMGELYAANPFESFLLMCILSDEPFTTYSDVLELSYSGNAQSSGVPDET